MRILHFAIIISLGSLTFACSKSLDKEPLNLISEEAVFEDPALADAYLLDIYDRVPFQITGGQADFNMGMLASMGAEARPFGNWQDPYPAGIAIYDEQGAGSLEYWPYPAIRDINQLIEKLPTTDFEQEYIDQRTAEARFLRAFMYFEMAKRYGGVPIITTVQDQDDPADVLFPARNSEKEVYDFIASELDAIFLVLPEVYGSADEGRPTKWAAIAMKSRAMLYAASVANFGTEQLGGIVGFPSGDAQQYYQASLDASTQIIDSGVFGLYNKIPEDPVANFTQLFIDESGNPEVIFAERWDAGLNKGHSWDNLSTPAGFNAGWNSNFDPFVDFVELFDFTDGTSGNIDRSQYTSDNSWDGDWYFGQRDPRFRASFFYPEAPWQGKEALYHSATLYTDPADGQRKEFNSETIIPGTDWQAKAPNRNTVRTGFHIRKRVDESVVIPAADQSSTDFYVYRYGEILLNYAEAAFYLGNTSEALDKLNMIRERAGMPAFSSATEENIRHERQVELAFEEHRYWDLRRWRIAVEVLDGLQLQGFQYVYDLDKGEYILTLRNAEGQARVFQDRHYYFALGISIISDNPNLVENPGY